MATTKKEYRDLIEFRVGVINKIMNLKNSPYLAKYVPHYGGWNLQRYNEMGSIINGAFSFDYRKSHGEMVSYLDGVILGLRSRYDLDTDK